MVMETKADYKAVTTSKDGAYTRQPSERFVSFLNKVVAEERRKKNLLCGADPRDYIESRLWHAAEFDAYEPWTHALSLRDGFGLPKAGAKEYTRLIKQAIKEITSD
jgi:hypothetical protein